MFDALEFPAEVTQHIPDKGQHLIHYLGWYSNEELGAHKKQPPSAHSAISVGEGVETGAFIKQRRMSWAALITQVYEVEPLCCHECGGEIKIISFIEKC